MCRPARRGMITNSVFTIGLPTAGVRHTNNRYFKIHFSDNLQRIPHFFFQINEARVKFVFILREITIAKLNSTVERVRNEKWFNVRSKVDTANLTFTYLCIVNTILNYNQKVATFLDLFISKDALYVSGGSSAHHQEHITVHTASGIVNQY